MTALRKELQEREETYGDARTSLLEQLRASEQGRIDGEFQARVKAQEKVAEVEKKMLEMQRDHEVCDPCVSLGKGWVESYFVQVS